MEVLLSSLAKKGTPGFGNETEKQGVQVPPLAQPSNQSQGTAPLKPGRSSSFTPVSPKELVPTRVSAPPHTCTHTHIHTHAYIIPGPAPNLRPGNSVYISQWCTPQGEWEQKQESGLAPRSVSALKMESRGTQVLLETCELPSHTPRRCPMGGIQPPLL